MAVFKLPVDRLSEAGETFGFEAQAEWWAARAGRDDDELCEVEEPFRFRVEARRVGEDILLEGEFEGRVALECSRCAKRYSQPLRDRFQLALEPARGREPEDPEEVRGLAENGLCLGEELESGWFRGTQVGLDDFFGELIALSMPIQPLCDSDCPGVCAHCGMDLSVSQCDCADEKIDSPFAVLAKLKGGEE